MLKITFTTRDEERIEKIRQRLPVGNDEVSRRKASWIVMLQFWAELAELSGFSPEGFRIDSKFILRDDNQKILTFPLSPERNLWMFEKL